MSMDVNIRTEGATVKSKLLVDHVWVKFDVLNESNEGETAADGTKKIMVRGEFARAGQATENRRIYPGSLWEREVKRLASAMEERRLFGEMDHPTDGRTSLRRVSHVILNMELKDGILVGEAEVLPTPAGAELAALLKAGCKVGVSSRGYGSTRPNDKGEDVVQEDYRLVTFDMVAEPADSNAYPAAYYEHREEALGELTEEQMQAIRQEAQVAAEVELREEFTREMLGGLSTMRAELESKIRSELTNDPDVAASKSVVEQIALLLKDKVLPEGTESVVKDRDLQIKQLKSQLVEREDQIKKLESQITKLTDVAKEVGYKYVLESTLSGEPDAALIRKAIGNVKKFESLAELKTRVEALVADRKRIREQAKLAEQKKLREERELKLAREAEIRRTREVEEAAEVERDKMEEALTRSAKASELLAVQLYAERRLRNHPKAVQMSEMIEKLGLSTKEEVDSFIAKHREPARDSADLEAVRARVRARTSVGTNSTPEMEEKPISENRRRSRLSEGADMTGIGQSLDEFRALSGLVR